MIFRRILGAVCAVGFFFSILNFAAAETDAPLKVIYEWQSLGGRNEGYAAISPDGIWLARVGKEFAQTDKDAQGLYIKNVETKEEKLLFNGDVRIHSPVFAPDGKHITFIAEKPAGPTSMSVAYRVGTQSPGAAIAATDTCRKNLKCDVTNPLYSPDGSKMVLAMRVWEHSDEIQPPQTKWLGQPGVELPSLPHGHPVSYVGLLPAEAKQRLPVQIVEGTPFFWSTDSKAVYMVSYTGILTRFNVTTKISSSIMPLTGVLAETGPTPERSPQGSIYLGKIPDKDAIFVTNGQTVQALSLDNRTKIESELISAAETIKVLDRQSRILNTVQAVGKRRIFLRYLDQGNDSMASKYHVKLVEY